MKLKEKCFNQLCPEQRVLESDVVLETYAEN